MNKNLIIAQYAITRTKKPSTSALVLAEIINLSHKNIIYKPAELSPKITKTLSITPDLFRTTIAKLYKLNLIKKHGNTIILNPLITKPFKK